MVLLSGLLFCCCRSKFCSHSLYGVIVQVACFRRLPAKDGRPEKWLYLDTRRPHTHDVRAMLVLNPAGADSLLLTGANDAQLFAYSVSRFQTVSLLPVTLFPALGLSCHQRHV